ncbi:MAG: hypothetical protein AB1555_15675 [Nitrospirota bacterium]
MTARAIGVTALVLWVVTVAALGWFFIKGWTVSSSDGRTEILLAPAEREQILAEMRQLLKAGHSVVTGLSRSGADVKAAEQAARAAGKIMAADTSPAIMAKLPLAFKQMGMSIHQDMDALADAIVLKETPEQILQRLSSMTACCTTCHDLYRLGVR